MWSQDSKYSEEALQRERDALAQALERLAGVQRELALSQNELMAGQKSLAEQQDKLVQFLESPFDEAAAGLRADAGQAGPSSAMDTVEDIIPVAEVACGSGYESSPLESITGNRVIPRAQHDDLEIALTRGGQGPSCGACHCSKLVGGGGPAAVVGGDQV